MALLAGALVLSSLYGSSQAQQASDRERRYWRNQQRQRMASPAMQGLQDIYQESLGALQTLPGQLRRRREGSLSSMAQLQRGRIRESMARAGITGASEAGIRAERGLAGQLEQKREAGELGEAQLMQQLRGGVAGMGSQLLNLQFPSPGQTAQARGQIAGQYVDPISSAIQSLMMGVGLESYYGGQGGGPVGAQPGQQANIYNQLEGQGQGGYTYINPQYQGQLGQ